MYRSKTVPGPSLIGIADEPPNASNFNAKYFMTQKALLSVNAVGNWSALTKWTSPYFYQRFGYETLEVNIRPKDYSSELQIDKSGKTAFFWPMRKSMLMQDFILNLQNTTGHMHYMSFTLERNFQRLLKDVDLNNLSFITRSWFKTNWHVSIEDGRVVHGLQAIAAENLYAVISGYKDFILIPANQKQFLPVRRYAQMRCRQGYENIEVESHTIAEHILKKKWIPIDPVNPNFEQFPEYSNCTPITVRVNAGDVLYVPAGYFQHVRQSHGCISLIGSYDDKLYNRVAVQNPIPTELSI